MKYYYYFFITIFFLGSFTVASAQTSCLKYPSNSTAPAGYGASWDVTSTLKELLVKSNCPTSGNSLAITIGKGSVSQYIWSTMYVYGGSSWTSYTMTGTDGGGGWLIGQGDKTITMPFTPTLANPLHFVGYVCTPSGSGWKCGCRNTSCTTKHWQLQAYTGTGGGTSGGSTGGTTGGGTGGWEGGTFTPPAFYNQVKSSAAKLCYNPSNTRALNPGTGSITQGGTAANPLVYIPTGTFNGGTLNINAQYVVVKGGTFNGTNIQINVSNVRFTENILRVPINGTGIHIESSARGARIDRNIIDAGTSDRNEDIMIKVADGSTNPLYHRIDHNLFTGATGCCENAYVGDVNKSRESLSRSLFERNYFDATGRKYGIYTKSTENVIENNVFYGGNPRPGVRGGSRNVFFKNHFKGNEAAFTFDTDNYFVSNVFEGTNEGLWLGAGDCTFSLDDCLAGTGQPNHPNAVRTKVWGNLFKNASDRLTIGNREAQLEGGRAQRCPENSDLSGNSKAAVSANGCPVPGAQNVNPSVNPELIGLTESMVGPNGAPDTLCP